MVYFSAIVSKLYYLFSIFFPVLLFAFRAKKRKNFLLSTIIFSILVLTFNVVIAIMTTESTWTFTDTTWFNVIYFLINFTLATVMVFACFEVDFWGALFCGTIGYSIQHIWGKLVDYQISIRLSFLNTYLIYFICLSILGGAGALLYLFLIRKIIPKDGYYAKNNSFQIIIALIVVGVNIIYNAIAYEQLSLVSSEYPEFYQLAMNFIWVMSTLLAFMSILLELNMYKNRTVTNEVDTLNTMLQDQKHQYEMQKENIDLINIKCHDLKHQLSALNGKLSQEEVNETIKSINIYDSSIKTGNESIDIILSSKSLYCQNNGIRITCSLDGKLISFIPPHELYSIFGNSIDNAIESVIKLPEDERIIKIYQTRKGNLLSIHIENFYSGEIKFRDGMPQTSKDEGYYHGFGVKSIKMLIEKNGGIFSLTAENQIFSLNFFFLLDDTGYVECATGDVD